MKKMILSAVIIQLFAGCITVKDTNWEENRQVTSFAGPGSKDSKLVKWKKCERDSGKRVSVGFFPGGAEFLNGSNAGFLAYFLFTSFANVFSLGAPTLYSLFGGGFSDDSQNRELASLGIIGAYEWKDMKVAKTNVVKFANCEEVVERHSIYTPEKNIPSNGKTGDSTPLFFDYPGFNALFEKVNECGAVAVMHEEGSYSYRLFRRSKYVDGTMVYKDVDLGSDAEADRQVSYQRDMRKLRAGIKALCKHRGYPFADTVLKNDFSNHLTKIDKELRLCSVTSSSALKKHLENIKIELEKRLEKSYQDEVARVRKLEVERIAENVKKIEKLIEVENFNEVLKICEGELHQTKPGAKQDDARIWEKYKDKVKKCQVAKKVKKIEGLLKSGSFNEVLKICEGGLHPIKPGANQEDVRIWEKYKERAEKGLLAKKIREIEGLMRSGNFIEALKMCEDELHQTKPGAKHEDARIWEKYKERAQKGQKDKNRAAELARLAELKKKLEQLTSEEKWDEIITLCTTEQQNLSRECCLPEDKLIWDDFFAKAVVEKRVAEIARFEGMKSEVELLFNNSEWTNVIALCDKELERSESSILEVDRCFWRDHRRIAQEKLDEIRMMAEIKTLEEEIGRLTASSYATEIELGEKLVAWIKQKSNQTSLQRESTFKEYCNRFVLFKGTVENIGEPLETLWGEKTIYVSLNVEKSESFSGVNIKFLIDSSLRDQALKWNKGACVILRGLVSSQGDLFNKSTIRYAVPVSNEEYDRSHRIRSQISRNRNMIDQNRSRIEEIRSRIEEIRSRIDKFKIELGVPYKLNPLDEVVNISTFSNEMIEGVSITLLDGMKFAETTVLGMTAYVAKNDNASFINILFDTEFSYLIEGKAIEDKTDQIRDWFAKKMANKNLALSTLISYGSNVYQKHIEDIKNKRHIYIIGFWLEEEDAKKIRACLDSAKLVE